MQKIDIAILGGGIAGLWLLNLLVSRGYSVVLLEKEALGAGQTIASQGMIHGGGKYALQGLLTDASETIASMPTRWQACLNGYGTLDLKAVKTLAQDYFLFSDAKLTSRVTAFLGSKKIKGRVTRVKKIELPDVLKSPQFNGQVYRLQDFVIDVPSLIKELARPFHARIHTGQFELDTAPGTVNGVRLSNGTEFVAQHYILAAGQGNGELIEKLNLPVKMQLRPLKQVIVKGNSLPKLYAHAVSIKAGDKPRLTITTHYLDDGSTCWYLGGQLAEKGVNKSDEALIEQTKCELRELLPWLELSECTYQVLSINRAEPSQHEQKRPDTPYVRQFGNNTVCWPTKLTLTPLLGDMIEKLLRFAPVKDPQISMEEPVRLADAPWTKKK